MIFRASLAAALVAAAPAAAQEEGDLDVVGTMTVTIAAEERTFVIAQDGEPDTSGFRRRDGVVDVRIVARPDRTPLEGGPLVTLEFTVTGMGPTADATNATVTYVDGEGRALSTEEGTSEVSMTAFGLEEEEVTVAGNFASQLQREGVERARIAINGDFQASIRDDEFYEPEEFEPEEL